MNRKGSHRISVACRCLVAGLPGPSLHQLTRHFTQRGAWRRLSRRSGKGQIVKGAETPSMRRHFVARANVVALADLRSAYRIVPRHPSIRTLRGHRSMGCRCTLVSVEPVLMLPTALRPQVRVKGGFAQSSVTRHTGRCSTCQLPPGCASLQQKVRIIGGRRSPRGGAAERPLYEPRR
jgi:hypothetical protein